MSARSPQALLRPQEEPEANPWVTQVPKPFSSTASAWRDHWNPDSKEPWKVPVDSGPLCTAAVSCLPFALLLPSLNKTLVWLWEASLFSAHRWIVHSFTSNSNQQWTLGCMRQACRNGFFNSSKEETGRFSSFSASGCFPVQMGCPEWWQPSCDYEGSWSGNKVDILRNGKKSGWVMKLSNQLWSYPTSSFCVTWIRENGSVIIVLAFCI